VNPVVGPEMELEVAQKFGIGIKAEQPGLSIPFLSVLKGGTDGWVGYFFKVHNFWLLNDS